ncbi:MAG TPA: Rrf2 family transcriptional regulator [Phenylobacterium sp.]|nr:Rrf2 family transcriptional regulator [Phenylobacterium sp.]
MRLTVYTDYALRVLIYIAVRPEPKPTIGQIAASYDISRNHLMKVVYQLGVAGYIETVRGKNGGLRLARRPQDIGVGDVVRYTEPDLALVPCFDAENALCAITPSCKLRGVLFQARAAFLQVLDTYTLADLVENRSELQALLGAGSPPGPIRAIQPAGSEV